MTTRRCDEPEEPVSLRLARIAISKAKAKAIQQESPTFLIVDEIDDQVCCIWFGS